MIPTTHKRGSDMRGLLAYLYGRASARSTATRIWSPPGAGLSSFRPLNRSVAPPDGTMSAG